MEGSGVFGFSTLKNINLPKTSQQLKNVLFADVCDFCDDQLNKGMHVTGASVRSSL